MWFFVDLQLCSSWQDFNWLKGSRGLSAAAELLVHNPGNNINLMSLQAVNSDHSAERIFECFIGNLLFSLLAQWNGRVAWAWVFSNVTILVLDWDCTSTFRPRPGSGPWLLPSPASASCRNSNSEPISISTTQWHMSEWWTSAYLLVPSSIIRWVAVRGTGNWHRPKCKVQCASYVATNT